METLVRQGECMGKINMGRVIIAGLVAGLVADLLGYLVDGMLLAPQWADGMKALGHADFSSNHMDMVQPVGTG